MKKNRIQSILLGVLALSFHMVVHAMRQRSSVDTFNPPAIKNVPTTSQSSLPPVKTDQVQGVTPKAEPQTPKSPGFFDRIKSNFKEWQTGRELKSVEKRIDSVKNTIETRPGLQNNPLRKKELDQKLSDLETQQQTLKDTQQRRALKKEERTGQLTDENKILFETLKQKKWGAEAERLDTKQQDLREKEKKLSSSELQRLDKATQKIEESNKALEDLKKREETIEQEKTKATKKAGKILGIPTTESETTTQPEPVKKSTLNPPLTLMNQSVVVEQTNKKPIIKEEVQKSTSENQRNIPTPPPPPPTEKTSSGTVPPPPPQPPVDTNLKVQPSSNFPPSEEKTTEKKPLSTGLLGDIQKGSQLKKVDLTVVKKEDTNDSLAKGLVKRRNAIEGEDTKKQKPTLTLAQLEKEAQRQEKEKIDLYRNSDDKLKTLSDKEIKQKMENDEKLKIQEKNKREQEEKEKSLLDEKVEGFRKTYKRNYKKEELADDNFVIKKVQEKEEQKKKDQENFQKQIAEQKQELGGGFSTQLLEKVQQKQEKPQKEKYKNKTEDEIQKMKEEKKKNEGWGD